MTMTTTVFAAIVIALLALCAVCVCAAARWRSAYLTAESRMRHMQVQRDHAQRSLQDFQMEQTELLLRSAEGRAKSEEPTPFELGYVYRSLGMEVPEHLIRAEKSRDEVLDGILEDLRQFEG